MRFYFLSKSGESLPLAHRLALEGYEVGAHISKKEHRDRFRGIIRIDSAPEYEKDDYIIFDATGIGDLADRLRQAGHKVFGACRWADEIAHDRDAASGMARDAGAKTPRTYTFSTASQGMHHVRSNPDTPWLFLSAPGQEPCVIQEKIEGVGVTVEGWFDGERWVSGASFTIEDKRFMPGDLGPCVGSASNVVWVLPSLKHKLFRRLLWPLTPLLKAVGYVGPIGIKSMVSKEEPHELFFLEITPRLGYDAVYCHLRCMDADAGQYLAAFMDRSMKKFPLSGDVSFSASVRLSIPPYPQENPSPRQLETCRGVILEGPDSIPDDWWPKDMNYQDGEWCCAGTDGNLGVVTGAGLNIKSAVKAAYQNIERLNAANLQYRTDVGESAAIAVRNLREWGVLNLRSF